MIATTVEIPQEDPLTPGLNRKVASSFTLTVKHDCLNTILIDRTIFDMSQKVGLAAVTQDVAFTDSIATFHAIPAYCGLRSYMFSPTYGFLNIIGTTISLATSSIIDVRTYNVNLTVKLADYPAITPITKTVIITITCEVQTLAFSTVPSSTILKVGINPQPFDI